MGVGVRLPPWAQQTPAGLVCRGFAFSSRTFPEQYQIKVIED